MCFGGVIRTCTCVYTQLFGCLLVVWLCGSSVAVTTACCEISESHPDNRDMRLLVDGARVWLTEVITLTQGHYMSVWSLWLCVVDSVVAFALRTALARCFVPP